MISCSLHIFQKAVDLSRPSMVCFLTPQLIFSAEKQRNLIYIPNPLGYTESNVYNSGVCTLKICKRLLNHLTIIKNWFKKFKLDVLLYI